MYALRIARTNNYSTCTTIGVIATPTTATTPIAKVQLNGKCSNVIVIHNNIRSTKLKSIYSQLAIIIHTN